MARPAPLAGRLRLPGCGSKRAWRLEAKPWTWECADCGRQTSATAGTIMHGTHLPLRTWFIAAHLVATHSNGISALQLQAKLEIGSYKAAWLLLHKLRRAMVDPERDPLEGMVEIDETSIVNDHRNGTPDLHRIGTPCW